VGVIHISRGKTQAREVQIMARYSKAASGEAVENGKEVRSKHNKFRDLAESRTNKALDAIGRISNLSNRSLYEWDEAEVRKVLKALRDSVTEVEARFASPKGKVTAKFKL
jgi:hypothetical protein